MNSVLFYCWNPAGEAVAETANGQRWVAINHQWVNEKQLPPHEQWRAARAHTQSAWKIVKDAWCHPAWAKQYGFDVRWLWMVYRTPVGSPTPPRQKSIFSAAEQKELENCQRFLFDAAAVKAHEAWKNLGHRNSEADPRRLDLAIHPHLGIPYGAAERLHEIWFQQHQGQRLTLEFPNQISATEIAWSRWRGTSSWIIDPSKRWPVAPSQPMGFREPLPPGYESRELWSPWMHGTALLRRLQAAPNEAKPWLQTLAQSQGWVIWRAEDYNHEQRLREQALKSNPHWFSSGGHAWFCNAQSLPIFGMWWFAPFALPHLTKGLTSVNGKPAHFHFENWLPPVKCEIDIPEGDEFGRIPVRRSDLQRGEAYAPRRLALAMEKAWDDLCDNITITPIAQLCHDLDVSVDALASVLSLEQQDAAALAWNGIRHHQEGFILADETGFGKGRTLATLAQAAVRQHRSVLFITENANLFSDFYRDLLDISPAGLPLPPISMVHEDAKIRAPDGSIAIKAISREYSDLPNSLPDWHKEGRSGLILGTYAQFRQANDEKKAAWVKEILGNTGIVLLDEVHNVVGNSQTGKMVGKIVQHAGGMITGSATFAKQEGNLKFFGGLIAPDKKHRQHLFHALSPKEGSEPPDDLRRILAESLAKKGLLVRREHPPVPPPVPKWYKPTPDQDAIIKQFRHAIQAFYRLMSLSEKVLGNPPGSAWIRFGGMLSRGARELALYLKVPAIINEIELALKEGRKPVIGIDSTLEGPLATVMGWGGETDGDGDGVDDINAAPMVSSKSGNKKASKNKTGHIAPQWRYRWRSIIDYAAPDEIIPLVEQSPDREAWYEALDAAKNAMENLPAWPLSPLDWIQCQLRAKRIKSGELSGRQWTLVEDDQAPGGWDVRRRAAPDRTLTIRDFNSGEIDVLFITRAGAVGVSVHASKRFKDQRQRVLLEWDISPNPVVRVQFWGRVRRRDQVSEPLFTSVLFEIPSEIRRQQKEENKRYKMAAHAGSAQQRSVSQEWVSARGDRIIQEWAADEPRWAKILGLKSAGKQEGAWVDRLLMRCWILPEEVQDQVLARLSSGMEWNITTALNQEAWYEVDRMPWIAPWTTPPSHPEGEELSNPHIWWVKRKRFRLPPPTTEQLKAHWQKAKQNNVSAATLREELKAHPAGIFSKQMWSVGWPEWKTWEMGSCLSMKSRGLQKTGVFLGFALPEPETVPLGLCQVAAEIWWLHEPAPVTVSMDIVMEQVWKSTGQKSDGKAFLIPAPVEERGFMEGNPVFLTAWGQKWGVGCSSEILNESLDRVLTWSVPPEWTWEDVARWPKDADDLEKLLAWWRSHPQATIYAAIPMGRVFIAQQTTGGVVFMMDEETWKIAEKDWLDMPMKKAMGKWKESIIKGQKRWVTTIKWDRLRYALELWRARGVDWRV